MLILPFLVHAESTTVWEFSQARVPGQWTVKDLTSVKPSMEGLHVQTQREGLVWRAVELLHPIDVVTVTLTSSAPIEANLLWKARGDPPGRLAQFAFAVEQANVPVTIDIIPGTTRQWNPSTTELGFSFPKGADVVIHDVRLRGWSVGEKFLEGIKSFWVFDTFRPYSINFLWGPLLGFSPPAREQLFQRLPPLAISAVRIFYALLLLLGIGGIVLVLITRGSPRVKRYALTTFGGTFIAVWLLFDVRMGLEILNYARTDMQTYVRPPIGRKKLRTHGDFYDIAQQAMPMLRAVPRYALITENDSPFYQNLRYMTYPALPIVPGNDLSNISLLLVLHRPDIVVHDNRVILQTGETVAADGRVIADYGSGSFLYGKP